MSVVIVLYKIIVTWWYMYGNYSVTNPDISQNVLLIIVNGMICLSCFINMKLRKGRIKMLEKISMLKKIYHLFSFGNHKSLPTQRKCHEPGILCI